MQVTWQGIFRRALAHVRRDILLYAAEEPVGLELIRGFVEDAIGSNSTVSISETAMQIVTDLIERGLLQPPAEIKPERVAAWLAASGETRRDATLTLSDAGREWVEAYYQHLETVAGQRTAG